MKLHQQPLVIGVGNPVPVIRFPCSIAKKSVMTAVPSNVVIDFTKLPVPKRDLLTDLERLTSLV